MTNYLTIQDYESTPLTSSKSYKLKINNKEGKNRLNFDVEQISNSSRRSASFRKKSSSRLFRNAKIIPTQNLKTDNSESPKVTTPTMRSQNGKKVSFNLRDVKSTDKLFLCPSKKSSSKLSKDSMKVLRKGTTISKRTLKSEKQLGSEKNIENSQKDFFLPEGQQNSQNNQQKEQVHVNFVQRMDSAHSNGFELKKKKSKTTSKCSASKAKQLMESLSMLIMNNCNQIANDHQNKLKTISFEQSILAENENSKHQIELQMQPEMLISSAQLRDLSYLISQN